MNRNTQVKNEKTDRQLAMVLVLLYFIHFINNVAKSILPIPLTIWDLISYAGFAIGGVFVLLVLPKALRRYPIAFIVAEGVGVFFYCISFMQNNDNLPVILDRAF